MEPVELQNLELLGAWLVLIGTLLQVANDSSRKAAIRRRRNLESHVKETWPGWRNYFNRRRYLAIITREDRRANPELKKEYRLLNNSALAWSFLGAGAAAATTKLTAEALNQTGPIVFYGMLMGVLVLILLITAWVDRDLYIPRIRQLLKRE